jgi:DMSO/TMAO reductase YedYZ heme-binding membrane subunit
LQIDDNYKKTIILLSVFLLYVISGLSVLLLSEPDFRASMVQLFALYGFTSIFMATILSSYLREVRKTFGRPFMKVHHYFAIAGLIFITMHPVVFSIYAGSLLVFVPDVSSWYAFWSLAGRPALYIAYVAALAGLLRMRIEKYWKYLHGLMYIVLTFAYIHGFLIGANFANPIILGLFSVMLLLSYYTAINRYLKKRKTKST